MGGHDHARLGPDERYLRDSQFRCLVDMMVAMIAAATLAATRSAVFHARPVDRVGGPGGLAGRVDSWHGRGGE